MQSVLRQLGWLPPSSDNDAPSADLTSSPATNRIATAKSTEKQRSRTEQAAEPDPAAPPPNIPGYASLGTNGNYDITLAMDTAMLPAGSSSLDVWVSPDSAGASPQYHGIWNIESSGSVLTLHNANSVFLSVRSVEVGSPDAYRWIFTNAPP
jgi:hypothetical protein